MCRVAKDLCSVQCAVWRLVTARYLHFLSFDAPCYGSDRQKRWKYSRILTWLFKIVGSKYNLNSKYLNTKLKICFWEYNNKTNILCPSIGTFWYLVLWAKNSMSFGAFITTFSTKSIFYLITIKVKRIKIAFKQFFASLQFNMKNVRLLCTQYTRARFFFASCRDLGRHRAPLMAELVTRPGPYLRGPITIAARC